MEELLADIFTNSLLVNKLQLLKHRRLYNKTQSKYQEITIHNYMKYIVNIIYESQSRNYMEDYLKVDRDCSKSTTKKLSIIKIAKIDENLYLNISNCN